MTSIILRRRGLPKSAPIMGAAMQRIDGAYVYELGAKLRPILSLREEEGTKRIHIHYVIGPAIEAIQVFLFNSVFIYHARTVHSSATALLDALLSMDIDFGNYTTFDEAVSEWSVQTLKEKFKSFEAILLAELQSFPLYLVFSKGGFDVVSLTDARLSLFPSSLSGKCHEAVDDILMGARSMAFELWTAMGFHFHRANEAVLRRYYESVIGNEKRPKHLTMGTMVSSMEQHDVGDSNIRAALKNITNFHRNPIAHPDHKIADGDEALSLYAAIRACMGYMLDKLPVADVDQVIELTPIPEAPLLEVNE
jgi:hypothetical protein